MIEEEKLVECKNCKRQWIQQIPFGKDYWMCFGCGKYGKDDIEVIKVLWRKELNN